MSRRSVLGGAVGAAVLFGASGVLAGNALAAPGGLGRSGQVQGGHGRPARRIPRDHISIQLYTLRSLLEQDFEATLAEVAGIGYRKVELAGTYGRTAEQVKSALDRFGLLATSSHVGVDMDVDQAIADAKTLGHRYVVVPWAKYETIAEWQALATRLDEAGKAFRRAGLRLGYHNHAHEFAAIDGARPFDVLRARTSKLNVYFELDLYWAVDAGVNPVDVVRDTGRVLQFHVKDRATDGSWADLGTGTIDFADIFRRTWRYGLREYIVEHDNPTDPLATARVGYEYLTNLRF